MKLYLIRHGEALSAHIDAQRVLSEHGRIQVAHLATQLRAEDIHPAHIYHSEFLRAKQTATILAEHLKITAVDELEGLLPDDNPAPIYQQINTWTEDTIVVSHLPYLPRLLRLFSQEGHYIVFETSTAVCLERSQASSRWAIQTVWNA
jgi:phosphohistidine phosphatase SixA